MRIVLWILAALVAAIGIAYYPLVMQSPPPERAFPLDFAKVRALAQSLPGAKATDIRYERVLALEFAEAMTIAGAPWRSFPMQIYSYQLVFPEQTLVLDTAMPREMAKPDALVMDYDDAAYGRVTAAMEKAAQIVITHEHGDHIGGLAAHPHLGQILPHVKLTAEQFASAGHTPSTVALPATVTQGYQPLTYDAMTAIAPGVVLIKAPGHTPGSQMIYVQRADGRELLFLGDVSWRMKNIEEVRERPLLMTLIIGEDRQAVLGQFQALKALRAVEPGVALVPGHEGAVIKALEAGGLLTAGFR